MVKALTNPVNPPTHAFALAMIISPPKFARQSRKSNELIGIHCEEVFLKKVQGRGDLGPLPAIYLIYQFYAIASHLLIS
jgi:hypothetical protein